MGSARNNQEHRRNLTNGDSRQSHRPSRKRPGRQAVGTRDPAGAIESRPSQRLDRVYGRERAGLAEHVLWFGVWVTVNSGMVGRLHPFDPFPFPLLAMTVSLEEMFLALFVLASQNRLSRQADKRSHLDLQIDLLAEREMTAVLQLLQDIAGHLEVQTTITPEQLRDLMKEDRSSTTHQSNGGAG